MELVIVKEERLIEITSTISRLDGPLVVLGYLTSLKESDMYLFLNYVKGSKFGKLDFYKAIKMFSDEYLNNKNVINETDSLKKFGYTPDSIEKYKDINAVGTDYLYQYVISSLAEMDNSRRKR